MFLEDRSIVLIIYCLITVNYFIILYFIIITSGYGCDCFNIVYVFFLQNVYYIKT